MSIGARLQQLRRDAGSLDAPAPGDPARRVAAADARSPVSAPGCSLTANCQPSAGVPGRQDDTGFAPELARRIERLRRRAVPAVDLEQLCAGRFVADGVLLIEHSVSLDSTWHERTAAWSDMAPLDIANCCFIDTETTGLSGGVGTCIFLIGLGLLEPGRLCLQQYLLTTPAAEAALWAIVQSQLDGRSLVSYNGKSFDWPLIAGRQRLCRRRVSAPPQHLDLLHWVRRAFAHPWPDCRLATCESRLLKRPRTDDMGGELAPWAYREFLTRGRTGPLLGIIHHHRQDVLSLAELLAAVPAVYGDPQRFGADAVAVARWWASAGQPDRAVDLLKAEATAAALRERGRLHRRLGNLEAARDCWERLEGHGDPMALEALAKYHEHVSRQPTRALEYCRMLIELQPTENSHRRRQLRLERKLAASGGLR